MGPDLHAISRKPIVAFPYAQVASNSFATPRNGFIEMDIYGSLPLLPPARITTSFDEQNGLLIM